MVFSLATPYPLLAQEGQAHYHHYAIVELGTFGGPNSYVYGPGESSGTLEALMLNQRGTATGAADTNAHEIFCQTSECLVIHAFSWKDGILTDLESLPGINDNDSFPESINAKGDIARAGLSTGPTPVLDCPYSRLCSGKMGRSVTWELSEEIRVGPMESITVLT